MSRITAHVELAFIPALQAPVPGDWVDITPYARRVAGRKGRDHELTQAQAGEITSLLLKNTDRRFDPSNAASPYWPNLNIMTRLRIRAEYKGVFYGLFQGYIEDWGQTWPPRPVYQIGDAEAVVRAVDAFKVFSLLPVSTYVGQVMADGPVNYFRLDDNGNDPADAMGSASALVATAGNERPRWGVNDYWGLPRAIHITALAGTFEQAGPGANPTAVYNGDGDLSIEFIAGGDGGLGTGIVLDDGDPYRIAIGGTGTSQYLQFGQNSPGGLFGETVTSPVTFNGSGAVHHHVATRAGRLLTLYTDGLPTYSQQLISKAATVPGLFTLGGPAGFHAASFDGLMSHLAIYDYPLSAAQVANHHAQVAELIPGGVVSDQIQALLNTIPWPAGLTNLDTSIVKVADWIPDGTNVLDALSRLAFDTEFGLMFMTGDGVLRFVSHPNMLADIVPAATFGDLDPELGYEDLQLRFDDTDLATQVVVTRDGGSPQKVADPGSAVVYGPRELDWTTRHATDDDAYVAAAGLLGQRMNVNLRIEALKARSGS